MSRIPALIGVFAYLSLVTFGGGVAALPELQTLTVDVHHWLTVPQLVHFYSIGQAAPAPNLLMIVTIGERVGGPLGALAVLLAYFLPNGLLAFGVGRLWSRLEGWPWRDAIQRGLAPVAVGLVLAGALSLAKGALTGWPAAAIAAAVFAATLATRINPAFLVLGGGLVGLLAFHAGS
jgi:chromate transporter